MRALTVWSAAARARIVDAEKWAVVRVPSSRPTERGVAMVERKGQVEGKARKAGVFSLETIVPDIPDMQ